MKCAQHCAPVPLGTLAQPGLLRRLPAPAVAQLSRGRTAPRPPPALLPDPPPAAAALLAAAAALLPAARARLPKPPWSQNAAGWRLWQRWTALPSLHPPAGPAVPQRLKQTSLCAPATRRDFGVACKSWSAALPMQRKQDNCPHPQPHTCLYAARWLPMLSLLQCIPCPVKMPKQPLSLLRLVTLGKFWVRWAGIYCSAYARATLCSQHNLVKSSVDLYVWDWRLVCMTAARQTTCAGRAGDRVTLQCQSRPATTPKAWWRLECAQLHAPVPGGSPAPHVHVWRAPASAAAKSPGRRVAPLLLPVLLPDPPPPAAALLPAAAAVLPAAAAALLPTAAALLPAAAAVLPAAGPCTPPSHVRCPAAAAGWLPRRRWPAPESLQPPADPAAQQHLKRQFRAPATQKSIEVANNSNAAAAWPNHHDHSYCWLLESQTPCFYTACHPCTYDACIRAAAVWKACMLTSLVTHGWPSTHGGLDSGQFCLGMILHLRRSLPNLGGGRHCRTIMQRLQLHGLFTSVRAGSAAAAKHSPHRRRRRRRRRRRHCCCCFWRQPWQVGKQGRPGCVGGWGAMTGIVASQLAAPAATRCRGGAAGWYQHASARRGCADSSSCRRRRRRCCLYSQTCCAGWRTRGTLESCCSSAVCIHCRRRCLGSSSCCAVRCHEITCCCHSCRCCCQMVDRCRACCWSCLCHLTCSAHTCRFFAGSCCCCYTIKTFLRSTRCHIGHGQHVRRLVPAFWRHCGAAIVIVSCAKPKHSVITHIAWFSDKDMSAGYCSVSSLAPSAAELKGILLHAGGVRSLADSHCRCATQLDSGIERMAVSPAGFDWEAVVAVRWSHAPTCRFGAGSCTGKHQTALSSTPQPCCSMCASTLCICYNLIAHTLISTAHNRQLKGTICLLSGYLRTHAHTPYAHTSCAAWFSTPAPEPGGVTNWPEIHTWAASVAAARLAVCNAAAPSAGWLDASPTAAQCLADALPPLPPSLQRLSMPRHRVCMCPDVMMMMPARDASLEQWACLSEHLLALSAVAPVAGAAATGRTWQCCSPVSAALRWVHTASCCRTAAAICRRAGLPQLLRLCFWSWRWGGCIGDAMLGPCGPRSRQLSERTLPGAPAAVCWPRVLCCSQNEGRCSWRSGFCEVGVDVIGPPTVGQTSERPSVQGRPFLGGRPFAARVAAAADCGEHTNADTTLSRCKQLCSGGGGEGFRLIGAGAIAAVGYVSRCCSAGWWPNITPVCGIAIMEARSKSEHASGCLLHPFNMWDHACWWVCWPRVPTFAPARVERPALNLASWAGFSLPSATRSVRFCSCTFDDKGD